MKIDNRKNIKSLREYIEKIEDLIKQKGENKHVVFRGQNTDEPLKPKLGRVKLRNSKSSKSPEVLLFEEFKRSYYPLAEFKPNNDLDLLALAQHHGLPTRLLDWSYNALIALWFAVSKETKKNQNAVVYLLFLEEENFIIEKNIQNFNIFEYDKIIMFRSTVVSKRISSQSGLFSLHNKDSKGNMIALEESNLNSKLIKITINSESISSIRNSLQNVGINNYSVFPDIDGLCNHLGWKHTLLSDEKETEKQKIYELW